MIDFKTDNNFLNKEVNETLESIIKKKVFSNGYIFYGPEGIGKKQTAIKFVQEIFNLYSKSNIEKKIIDNNYSDFLLVEPTYFLKGNLINRSEAESYKNNKETIRIEQVRNIKIFLGQKSIESQKKIVLILDAHLLNEAASNCLLKILEEPTNGIFILLTSRINLLLDTIISRCQLVRFKSFSSKQLEIFIRNNLDSSLLNNCEKFNYDDFINSANGSPGKILNDIKIWNELPHQIKDNIDFPLNDNLEIFEISQIISDEMEINQQIFLINFLQNKWWEKTKSKNIIKKLEELKVHLKSFIQPRLAWEIILLRIANEDL